MKAAGGSRAAWAKQEGRWDEPSSPRGGERGSKCGDRLYIDGMLARSKKLAKVTALQDPPS